MIKTEQFLHDCPNDGKEYTLCRKISQFGKRNILVALSTDTIVVFRADTVAVININTLAVLSTDPLAVLSTDTVVVLINTTLAGLSTDATEVVAFE